MSSITEGLMGQLQGAPMARLGEQLGMDPAQTQQAVSAALPLLIGTLGRNAQQPDGAQSLLGALQRDHAGQDLGSVLQTVLGGGGQGGQILGHVFGNRQERAAEGLGQVAGLPADKAHTLLKWLAPLALAYLAKRMFDQRAQGASAPATGTAASGVTPQVLGRELGEEEEHISRSGGLGGGLLGAVLDRNRDGKVDVADLVGAIPPRRGGGMGNVLH